MGFYLENGWKRKKEVMMDVKPTDIQRPHFFIDDGPQMCFYVEKGGARVTRCLLKRDFFHENIKGIVHTETKLVIVDICNYKLVLFLSQKDQKRRCSQKNDRKAL